jgi:hypothetical protein
MGKLRQAGALQTVSAGAFNETKVLSFQRDAGELLPAPQQYGVSGAWTQNSLVVRSSVCRDQATNAPRDIDSDCRQRTERAVRELMLACAAGAAGFGPEIYAAYLVPAVFENGAWRGAVFDPQRGWLANGQSGFYYRAVLVMENGGETLHRVGIDSKADAEQLVVGAVDLARRLGEAGFLHCDIKRGNVLRRSSGELLAIDFDPPLCKVASWAPVQVLQLFNATLLLAELMCGNHAKPRQRLVSDAASVRLPPLIEAVNRMAATEPDADFARLLRTTTQSPDVPAFGYLNDLLSCRAALKEWANAYLRGGRCGVDVGEKQDRPILASALGFVVRGDQGRAGPGAKVVKGRQVFHFPL